MSARHAKPERPEAARAKRIVVKIGSGVLTENGDARPRIATGLARQISTLLSAGREVVLVSSGAIALGAARLGWSHPGRTIPEKQAAAAVGQIALSELWRARFRRHAREVAQVLLTRSGLHGREQFLNARHTLLQLLKLGVVPVVNENDTVATEEIRFGDNDNLSATVVNLVGADLLVILTDVDGLHAAPPSPRARHTTPVFGVVERVTRKLETAAGASASAFGRGGMVTKLEAAKSAARSGAATVLCNGARPNALLEVAAGRPCGTLFRAGERLRGRKHWLAFTAKSCGALVCDAGAVRAIGEQGRSLLPAGIVRVDGRFRVGDLISLTDTRGRAFARGLVAYASDDVERIKGGATNRIHRLLGYSNGAEVVHRDDLALLGEGD